MKHADFVHLHNHSHYSLLDGANPIGRLVERAAEFGMPAIALTDHGSMFGAVEFYQEARRVGVKPLLGMEAYVTRKGRKERTRDPSYHLVLLARNEQGFKNLMKLSSLAFLEGFYYKPRVDHELLAQYSEGLLALSACPKGEVASDLLEGNLEGAERTVNLYRDMFGAENYFLEIQDHGLSIEDRIREQVKALASRTGVPLVATNDCHYLRHEDATAHDVLLCIQTGRNVDDKQRMRFESDQLYVKSPDEMRATFPDAPQALLNTLAVAERCDVQLNFGQPLLPAFPLPPGQESPEAYLRELAAAELKTRFPELNDAIRERCDYELDVICRMGFASYFLIVRDFIAYARSRGVAVGPGRGSVAGSLVAYAMRITDINPLEHGLIFERFLNPERVTMPDIDIDFDDLRRGEIIDYVKERYGHDNVTQIITFGTMGAKGALRDVGRALGMAYADVDRIARLVPDGVNMNFERAMELSSDLKNVGQRGAQYERLLKTAQGLEGLARHASTHAAGVLITPGPLLDYVPLYRQKDDSITTQWDMKSIEKAGLLKMDFLGLRTLSVLQESVALIAKHRGRTIELRELSTDDPSAYQVFQDAETVGIFQFESSGMRDYLRRLKPTVFEDLVAMNALYRPGPMENIPYFIDCKHGRRKVSYEHPDLEPVLKSTYGVFVYQEQVMEAAHRLAGFSMAQGDELRRAMGKKRQEEMDAKRQAFVEGCKHRKIPPARAQKIFATMEKFAGYGFNKCLVGETVIVDALSGEKASIADLFHNRRSFVIHALGEDEALHPQRVADVVWNGRKPVFEMRTASGRTITATGNHPFRTLYGWTHLEDLKPGDAIAAARRLPIATTSSWPRHELVALAGLLAEGNTCHPSTLYFYGNDVEMVRTFANAIGGFPNTVAKISSRTDGRLEASANTGRDTRFSPGQQPWNAFGFHGNLAVAADPQPTRSGAFLWASSLGLLGRKAPEKTVPKGVFELDNDSIATFLGFLWTGDGFIAGKGNYKPFYATSSPFLAEDLRTLLLRLGIPSSLKQKAFRYRGAYKQGYTVHIVGDGAVELFAETIVPHIVGRDEQIAFLQDYLSTTDRGRTSKDTIPAEIRSEVDALRRARGLTWVGLQRDSGVSMKEFVGNGSETKRGFRRSTILKLSHFFNSVRLRQLAQSDIYWDRIVSVEPRGVQDTYDLTVENDHNFVADGLVVHNSHSAAYALLAYQCAYLKSQYPPEFLAATLTSEMSDSARIVTLIEECRRLKIEILPPEVNRSDWKFTIEDGAIRFGLGAVKNVGQSAVEAVVAAREAGPFESLFDLAQRLDARAMNRRVLESLVAAGACDSLGEDRGALFAGAGKVLEYAATLQRERASGQSTLFGDDGEHGVAVVAPPLPAAEPWSARDRSTKEKEVLGFYFSEHPLAPMREELAKVSTHKASEIAELEHGSEVRLAALVGEVRKLNTKSGRRMAIVTLEDLSGRVECTVFPDLFESAGALMTPERLVVASGRVEARDDFEARILLSDLVPYDEAQRRFRPSLHLEARGEDLSVEWLEGVDEVLSSCPGECEVYLYIVMPDHSRRASRSKRYRVAEGADVIGALRMRFPTLRGWWGKGGP